MLNMNMLKDAVWTLIYTLILVLVLAWTVNATPLTCEGSCGQDVDPVVGPYYWVSTIGGVEGVGLNLFGDDTTGSALTVGPFTAPNPLLLWLRFDTEDEPDFDYFWVKIISATTTIWPIVLSNTGEWIGPLGFDVGPGPISLALGVVNTFDTQYPSWAGVALANVPVDPVPEPGTLLLVSGGLLAAYRVRKRRAHAVRNGLPPNVG